MTSQKSATPETRRGEQSLDQRYGKIGIPAVAAALVCQGDVKRPGDGSTEETKERPGQDERFIERAA